MQEDTLNNQKSSSTDKHQNSPTASPRRQRVGSLLSRRNGSRSRRAAAVVVPWPRRSRGAVVAAAFPGPLQRELVVAPYTLRMDVRDEQQQQQRPLHIVLLLFLLVLAWDFLQSFSSFLSLSQNSIGQGVVGFSLMIKEKYKFPHRTDAKCVINYSSSAFTCPVLPRQCLVSEG